MLAKLPGMGRVKRRVDEQQELEEGHRPRREPRRPYRPRAAARASPNGPQHFRA